MDTLRNIILSFKDAPVNVTLDLIDGTEIEVDNPFDVLLTTPKNTITKITLIIGEPEEFYNIEFHINSSITTTITYHTMDYKVDSYDGHYTGSTSITTIEQTPNITYQYDYQKYVVVPVAQIVGNLGLCLQCEASPTTPPL